MMMTGDNADDEDDGNEHVTVYLDCRVRDCCVLPSLISS